jgi:uncharacterized protein YneF (UPF0154 family)
MFSLMEIAVVILSVVLIIFLGKFISKRIKTKREENKILEREVQEMIKNLYKKKPRNHYNNYNSNKPSTNKSLTAKEFFEKKLNAEKFPEKTEEEKQEIIEKVNASIERNSFLFFKYGNEPAFVKSEKADNDFLTAYCYLSNSNKNFNINGIEDLSLKVNYILDEANIESIDFSNDQNKINYAIKNKKYLRFHYSKPVFISYENSSYENNINFKEDGNRTIKDINYSINVLPQEDIEYYNLNSGYLTGFCFKRNANRTFKIERMDSLEILNL